MVSKAKSSEYHVQRNTEERVCTKQHSLRTWPLSQQRGTETSKQLAITSGHNGVTGRVARSEGGRLDARAQTYPKRANMRVLAQARKVHTCVRSTYLSRSAWSLTLASAFLCCRVRISSLAKRPSSRASLNDAALDRPTPPPPPPPPGRDRLSPCRSCRRCWRWPSSLSSPQFSPVARAARPRALSPLSTFPPVAAATASVDGRGGGGGGGGGARSCLAPSMYASLSLSNSRVCVGLCIISVSKCRFEDQPQNGNAEWILAFSGSIYVVRNSFVTGAYVGGT